MQGVSTIRENTRSPEWKQGWTDRTMSSLNAPPLPLLTFFGIVIFYLYLSTYFTVKEEYHRTMFNIKLILILVPALLFFIMRYNDSSGRWYAIRLPKPDHDSFHRAGGSPWGVALILVLLLVMISYHSSVGSQWFRPLWYTHYY